MNSNVDKLLIQLEKKNKEIEEFKKITKNEKENLMKDKIESLQAEFEKAKSIL